MIDPAQGLNGLIDVGVTAGRVAALARGPPRARGDGSSTPPPRSSPRGSLTAHVRRSRFPRPGRSGTDDRGQSRPDRRPEGRHAFRHSRRTGSGGHATDQVSRRHGGQRGSILGDDGRVYPRSVRTSKAGSTSTSVTGRATLDFDVAEDVLAQASSQRPFPATHTGAMSPDPCSDFRRRYRDSCGLGYPSSRWCDVQSLPRRLASLRNAARRSAVRLDQLGLAPHSPPMGSTTPRGALSRRRPVSFRPPRGARWFLRTTSAEHRRPRLRR